MMKISDIKSINNIDKSVLEYMDEKKYEKVIYCSDESTKLKAIIAIHNTNLGPALGGTRMWKYDSISDATKDVLRLSRGMTYKAAITGLNLGGGKAVIISGTNEKTDDMMRAFGRFVESQKGKYITAEDVGMTTYDMGIISQETKHVVGKPIKLGGSGDPSIVTAYGVLMGIKGSAKFKWGIDNLTNKTVLIQGVGNVGENLIKLLIDENAEVFVNDVNEERLHQITKTYNVKSIKENIYDANVDVYAPCALGATLNNITIPKLKCSIVAGAANNQLAKEHIHDEMLMKYNILYAPDFLINAGGLINVYSELKGFSKEQVKKKTENIFDTTIAILKKSKDENISSQTAALKIAKERVFQHQRT